MKKLAGMLAGLFLALVLAVPALAANGGKAPSPYGLLGTWTMTEGEVEGWHYTAEEVGAEAEVTVLAIGPGVITLDYLYRDRNGNENVVREAPLKLMQGSLYEGCENSSWFAEAKLTGIEMEEEYDMTLLGEDRMLLMHFFKNAEGYQGVSMQWFRRGGADRAELPGDILAAGGEKDPRPADPGAQENKAEIPATNEIKGSWNATDWPDATGTLWESSVEIVDGGEMRYAFGHPGQMYETYYSGIWEYQEDTGMLYFYLHLTDNLGGGEKEPYIEGAVNVSRTSGNPDQLMFRSAGGATFLPEKEGDTVTYTRSVG